MEKIYILYVGADNKTKLLYTDFQLAIVSQYFESYTYIECNGVWKGSSEYCLRIEIATDDRAKLYSLVGDLKARMEQTSILVVEINSDINFV